MSILTGLIAFASLLILVTLHELGHFFFAKKFGVSVEEFGIGLPPRLWGRKIGETIYSLNLLPLGAFVRLEGEEGRGSFSTKAVWQRFLIIAGGVAVFWVVAAIIFSVLAGTTGIPLAKSARVQVNGVMPSSPAQAAGIRAGDVIMELRKGEEEEKIERIDQVSEFVSASHGQDVTFVIEREGKQYEVPLVPRPDPPLGEGPTGIALGYKAPPVAAWYAAPLVGTVFTVQMTGEIVHSFADVIQRLVRREQLPPGAEVSGPIGVVVFLGGILSFGPAHFFAVVALLSIYLALFNTLPIPALDGGRMLFLALEGVRGKQLSGKVTRRAVSISFSILIILMLVVTARDIIRLF